MAILAIAAATTTTPAPETMPMTTTKINPMTDGNNNCD